MQQIDQRPEARVNSPLLPKPGETGGRVKTEEDYHNGRAKLEDFPPLDAETEQEITRRTLVWVWLIVLFLTAFLLAALIVIGVLLARVFDYRDGLLPSWGKPSPNGLGIYTRAAVASDNGFCSEVGRDILLEGGNAVDAAIASLFCVGAMNPHSAGLGGGHFMTVYNSTTGQTIAIDAREVAPLSATWDMYGNNTEQARTGWRSIAVPGELAGLWAAYSTYGSGHITWTRLIQPTIDMLERGVVVSSAVAKALKWTKKRVQPNFKNSTMHIYVNPVTDGVYKTGDVMKRPVLAKTLRQLAESVDPVKLFYQGTIADAYLKEFRDNGAEITGQDLANYKVRIEQKTICGDIGVSGLVACGPAPPSATAMVVSILQTMQSFGVSSANLTNVDDITHVLHTFIEAMKFAYGVRSEFGDPAFVANAQKVAEHILTGKHTAWLHDRIPSRPQPIEYYDIDQAIGKEDHGTSHLSIIDQDGNAVSATSTINWYFGAVVRSESTGIIWNNEMDDFSLPDEINGYELSPTEANYIQPGKRPASSMAPLIIHDKNTKKVKLVIGAAGGARIISGIAYAGIGALWFNETLKEAIDAPRLHDQLTAFKTVYDAAFPQTYVDKLSALGHNMTITYGRQSVVTAVMRVSDTEIHANSDYRKGPSSYPAGY